MYTFSKVERVEFESFVCGADRQLMTCCFCFENEVLNEFSQFGENSFYACLKLTIK